MTHHITDRELATMACMQLSRLIEKGIQADDCKREWRRRWRAEWPQEGRRRNGLQSRDGTGDGTGNGAQAELGAPLGNAATRTLLLGESHIELQ